METFLERIDDLVKVVKAIENKKIELGKILRNELKIEKIEKFPQKNAFSVASVDGGLLKKSLQGIDIVVVRAAGVIYSIENSKVKKIDYFPKNPEPKPSIWFEPYSQIEFEIKASIERQREEIELATQIVKKFNPDFILLDGSIIPHYTLPSKDSLIFDCFTEMIKAYKNFFDEIKKSKTLCVGVVKDSRGKRFSEVVKDSISIPPTYIVLLEKMRDTNLLSYVLKEGECIPPFEYTSSPDTHPLLSYFPKGVSSLVYSFYLRVSSYDEPIRIDFFADKGVGSYKKIASLIQLLTPSKLYSIPSPLIEADKRARLKEIEIEKIYNRFVSKLGPFYSLFQKRRERKLG